MDGANGRDMLLELEESATHSAEASNGNAVHWLAMNFVFETIAVKRPETNQQRVEFSRFVSNVLRFGVWKNFINSDGGKQVFQQHLYVCVCAIVNE